MVDFNPIRDLRSPEADPFNVPAGQSTQEVEDIRLRLVLTREKTENVVKIIKNKGLTFKKDIEKIQELQRRLRTTIPRIPILRGDASTQIGSQVGLQRRGMSGLDFSRFFRSTKTPTKTSFPLLDIIITAIVIALSRGKSKTKINVDPKAVNKIKEFIRVKPKVLSGSNTSNIFKPNVFKPSVVQKPVKTTKGKVIEGDASTKTVDVDYEVVSDEPILTRLANIFKTRKLKKFSKEKGFVQFSKEADKIKLKTKLPFEFRTYDTKLEVNRYVQQLQRATSGRTKFKYKDPNELENLFLSNKADLQVMLKDRRTQLNNLTPGTEDYKTVQKSIRLVENGLKRINNSYKSYLNSPEKILKKNVQMMKESGLQYTEPMIENLRKDFFFRKKLRNLMNKEKVDLNVKPMSNDIAMLNTDTRDREFIIITRDA